MHKLIILLALIACALASSVEHQKHPQKKVVHSHHVAAHSGAAVGHDDHHKGRVARASHGRDLRVSSNGQKETVHHGTVVSSHGKQFRRVKKSQAKNNSDKLRRVHSSDKHRRH